MAEQKMARRIIASSGEVFRSREYIQRGGRTTGEAAWTREPRHVAEQTIARGGIASTVITCTCEYAELLQNIDMKETDIDEHKKRKVIDSKRTRTPLLLFLPF